ncbi:WbqC family protein [Variovorax paradoxus]|uniref:WbqC family protein n=1 Tax=Variovorax paradoxus TaxID=34073 RepID=UPI000A7FC6BF|nr:WbqC family protein [Variovorax paradoxus]
MKKIAGMQPYFFPYIGYWQLIDAVDCFVLFDEAQYIKQGWVNRNRILKVGGGWQYIQVPVAKHPMSASIREVQIAANAKWQSRILNQLAQYGSRAPFYEDTFGAIEAALVRASAQSIGTLNSRLIREICALLSIDTELVVSSDHGFDYSEVKETGDWALAHAAQLGATELINPIGGFDLLDAEKFKARGIGLSSLETPATTYSQSAAPFEPSLSIIDVLMHNGIAGTKELLAKRRIVCRVESAQH